MPFKALPRPQDKPRILPLCLVSPRFYRFLTQRRTDVAQDCTTTRSRSQLNPPHCSVMAESHLVSGNGYLFPTAAAG